MELVVLARYAFPRLNQGLKQREEKIRGDLERAEEARGEAETALQRYEQQLQEARAGATPGPCSRWPKLRTPLTRSRTSSSASPVPSRASTSSGTRSPTHDSRPNGNGRCSRRSWGSGPTRSR